MNKVNLFSFCDALCVFVLAFFFLLLSSFMSNNLGRDCTQKKNARDSEHFFTYKRRQKNIISQLTYFIPRIACRLPWSCRCLAQARVCAKILDLYNIPYSFHLGVRYGESKEFLAHAWVECGDVVVVGGASSPFIFSDLMR